MLAVNSFGSDLKCSPNNDYNGQDGLRIFSVFLILIASGIGAYFPLVASTNSVLKLPSGCFFFAKYFGSGVIIATGFVHLLEPAVESLGNPCLGKPFTEFPFAFTILQVAIFSLFVLDIVSHSYDFEVPQNSLEENVTDNSTNTPLIPKTTLSTLKSYGASVIGHSPFELSAKLESDHFTKQIVALFVLEFGLIFHSIFIGLSLAVAGNELKTLLAVLTFHQLFEGMGLGARIVEVKWPHEKRKTPWLLAFGFTCTTPLSIVAGLFLKNSLTPGSKNSLVLSGLLDAFSAGILIYTGLVELMANEFLYSNNFNRENRLRGMLNGAFFMMLGAALMTMLGKWA